ncbi:MAG: heparinase II/III family protein [Pirellulaceae bacterium]
MLRQSFFGLLCCLIGQIASAQTSNAGNEHRNLVQRNFPPSLIAENLVNRADFKPFPISKSEWESQLSDSIRARIVAAGDEALNFEFQAIPASVNMDYVRSGDRKRHSSISYPKRQALLELVLAEAVQREGRFNEAIFNGVWSICEESFWGVPAHVRNSDLPDVENPQVDLFAAETATVLCFADYFVGKELDSISPMIRKRIRDEVRRRIFDPMMNDSVWYFYLRKDGPVNNWNPWIMSNWLWCILLLEDDLQQREAMVNRAIENIDLYINGLGPEGGCDEGPSYWFAAGGCVFDFLETLELATNHSSAIFDEPVIQGMLLFPMRMCISERYAINFSDASPQISWDGNLLFRIGRRMGSDELMSFGAWAVQRSGEAALPSGFERGRKIQNLFTYAAASEFVVERSAPTVDWLADIQLFTVRTENGLFASLRGGNNGESHNHNDIGDVLVYWQGKPFIIDVGSGTYTSRTFSSKRYSLWYTRSDHHNVPIVQGQTQREGARYRASVVDVSKDSDIPAVTLELNAAYPAKAGISGCNVRYLSSESKMR